MSDTIKMAFDAIGFASQVLSGTDYAEMARSLRSQLDRAYFMDPTLALRVHADKTWDAKLRLLDAAAAFQRAIDAEREALGAPSREVEPTGAET